MGVSFCKKKQKQKNNPVSNELRLGLRRVGAGRKGEREVNRDAADTPGADGEKVPRCPDNLALGKSTIPQGSTLGIHSTNRVSARAMTVQIAWQIAISLGRGAASRALWFGKVQQTSRVQGSPGNTPFSAQGGHHPLHPGSSHCQFSVHGLPPLAGQGG